ncbi:uncharacterized protein [Drosophila pseudoobscura]|uniref:Uncharacterized protein isoform X1 n=1 Tax=Drosophila pseudoobscura pseudoobscura TaxID=46245 RepID=A0A6I8VGB4_DROPS|nr:uncharacterized protein LOC4805495 isoform X1 [Drosophila pseudoobscura]
MAGGRVLCATLLAWLTFLTVTHSVRITNLRVPHTYTLERDNEPDPLVLDCEYEIEPSEKGFVLKWLFNNHSIYQWIPSVKGFAMGFMKSKIDTKIFSMEGSPGVISIKNPDWNMTGEYTCAVQTFETTDKRSARLQIIVPESDFMLEARMGGPQSDVDIMCAVQHVFPQPILSVMFDTHILDLVLTELDQDPSGLYSMTVRTRIPRDQLESPTPITCAFILIGTNYTKRRETIFYADKASTIQRKWTTVAVVMSIASLALSS